MPIFCIEHFESVAMLSFTPGLQCLIVIRSATSTGSALLMEHALHLETQVCMRMLVFSTILLSQ